MMGYFDLEEYDRFERKRSNLAEQEGISISLLSALEWAGYAPGNYIGTCQTCNGRTFGAKRSIVCRQCALTMIEAIGSEAAAVRRRK